MTTNSSGRVSRWQLTRSRLAFGLGSAILIHEVAIREGGDRPYILLAALSLCGVASFLKLDEILKGSGLTIRMDRKEKPEEEQGEVSPSG